MVEWSGLAVWSVAALGVMYSPEELGMSEIVVDSVVGRPMCYSGVEGMV